MNGTLNINIEYKFIVHVLILASRPPNVHVKSMFVVIDFLKITPSLKKNRLEKISYFLDSHASAKINISRDEVFYFHRMFRQYNFL